MDEHKEKLELLYKEIEPLKAQLAEKTKARDDLFGERDAVRKQFEGKIAELRTLKRRRDELNRLVREKKDVRQKLTDQIRDLISQLNKAKESKDSERKSSGPGKNPAFLRQQLAKLEQRVETEALSPDAEKKLMKRIRDLKKELGEMDAFVEASSQVSTAVKELKKFKKDADDVHHEVQQTARESQIVHEQLTAVGKALDDLKPKEAEITERITKAKEAMNEVVAAIEEKNAQIRAIKEVQFAGREKEKVAEGKVNAARLQAKEDEVADKIKRGKKLTTDDLLVYQRKSSD